MAYVAIAGEGAGHNNMKEAVACAVLQKILGPGSSVPYSLDHGLLRSSIKVTEDFAVSGLNANYSDSGLVGAMFVAPSNVAGQITESVVEILKNGKVTDDWVNKGKLQLTSIIHSYGIEKLRFHDLNICNVLEMIEDNVFSSWESLQYPNKASFNYILIIKRVVWGNISQKLSFHC